VKALLATQGVVIDDDPEFRMDGTTREHV